MINLAVTCRFDFCHNLPYGIGEYSVSQLQLYQNNAAWIVSLWWKYDHITSVLKYLHWLPVEILLFAYKARHGMAPSNLSSLLSHDESRTLLRSEDKRLRSTPRYHTEGFASVVLSMLPFAFGTRYVYQSRVWSPLSFSRATWGHTCLMVHVHNVTWYFIILLFICCQLLAGVYLISYAFLSMATSRFLQSSPSLSQ